MATKRMLVDATHPEETRIVVTSGNRLEEFDFESASRRQLRGNIYLAKVTRVEPSLQAAFVEYGGNRHGFLAFSEIHPDYYQIPVADREALLADEAQEEQAEGVAEEAEVESALAEAAEGKNDTQPPNGDDDDHSNDHPVEHVGGDDALEEVPERKRTLARRYKIQEVIKRRQVMLVQVVKEERGNKGAALTSYLSLAGRYSVLMPNTARGGGISRKITNAADRKRLKDIAGDLKVPEGMGIILRTAGAARTKAEVKRDFEYLLRLWENVRNLTLKSQAPCLVYEEGSLIKRTIRDLYNKDIDEVLVAGEDAYREAKDFMRMIMPSHAKNVQFYKENQPVFSKYNVETQLDSMFSPQVTLPSGGYIVINPTEALVSIDVNSGKATKEHNIEDTALQTNLEAAEEVSRQLRLRDLAGLIVIDFIDMMEKRSIRQVERKLKDALRNDRARIQVGRISHFGLMEMSRQRMRFGVLESSTHICPTCQGAGIVRSVESLAVMVMRAIEEHVLRKPGNSIDVRVPAEVALYILNVKRASLAELEGRYDLTITVTADPEVTGNHFNIERGESRANANAGARAPVSVNSTAMAEIDDVEVPTETGTEDDDQQPRKRRRRGGRSRNRRENGDNNNHDNDDANHEAQESNGSGDERNDDQDSNSQSATDPSGNRNGDDDGEPRKRRRRGRRGGRRNRRNQQADDNRTEQPQDSSPRTDTEAQHAVEGEALANKPDVQKAAAEESTRKADAVDDLDKPSEAMAEQSTETAEAEPAQTADTPEAKPAPKPRRSRRKKVESEEAAAAEAGTEASVKEAAEAPASRDDDSAEAAEKPKAKRARRSKKSVPADDIVVTSTSAEDSEEKKPRKAGWWQKGFFG